MTTWFVTRHPGALEWARDAGVAVSDGRAVQNLDVNEVVAGDLVIGTLPIHLAAQIRGRGARYWHLALDVPAALRGKELTAQDMRECGARLEAYDVRALGAPAATAEPSGGAAEGDMGEVMICIASGQPQANFLPLFMRDQLRALCVVQSDSANPKIQAGVERTASRLRNLADMLKLDFVLADGAPSAPLADVERFSDEVLGRLRGNYPNARLVLNATGGTKLMSTGLSNRIAPVGEVIYCDTEHDRIEYFAPAGRAALDMPRDLMRLDQLMLAQGIEKLSADSDNPRWIEQARIRLHVSKKIGRTPQDWHFIAINSLAAKAEAYPSKKKPFDATQRLQRSPTNGLNHLLEKIAGAGLWTWDHDKTVTFADEDAVTYLKGGWLEELAACEIQALCEKHKIPVGHWAAGIEVRPADAQAAQNKPFNEIDLAIVWRNRLLVVECKTGMQAADDNDSQNIVNKLEAIRHYLGGPFSDLWLVSAQEIPNNSVAMDRCKQFGVRIVKPLELGRALKEWLKLP